MGPGRGHWAGPGGERSRHQGDRRCGPDSVGSTTLTSALLEHGLADELVLLVNPVLLGKGKRLFAEGTPARAFALEDTHAMPSGIVMQSYKAAGTLQNLR